MSRCFAWLRKPGHEELSALGNNMTVSSEMTSEVVAQEEDKAPEEPLARPQDDPAPPDGSDGFNSFDQQGADITVSPIRTLASHLLPPPPKRDWDVQKERRAGSLRKDRPEHESDRELQRTPESDESGIPRSDFVTRIPISTTGSGAHNNASNDVTGVSAVMVTADEPFGGGGPRGSGGALGGARSVTGISAVMVTGDDPYTSGQSRGKASNKLADNWFEKEDGEARGHDTQGGRSAVGDFETYMSVTTSPRSTNGKPKLFKNLSERIGLTNTSQHEGLDRNHTIASFGPSSSGNRTPSVAGSAAERSFKAPSSVNWFGNAGKKGGGRRNSRTGSQPSTRSKSRDRRRQETRAQDGAPATLPRLSRSVAGSAKRDREASSKRRGEPAAAERDWDEGSARSGKSGRSGVSRGRGKSRDPDGREPRTPQREGSFKSRDPVARQRSERNGLQRTPSAPKRGEQRGERDGRGKSDDLGAVPQPRGRSHGREPRPQSQGRLPRQQSQGREPRPKSRDPLGRQHASRGASQDEDGGGSAEGAPVKPPKAKERDGLKSSYISKWPFESRHPDELSFQAGAVLYPLAYAEDEGWLWMSVQKKSFRKGVSRGNVGEGEGLVPVTHLVGGETIPRQNWQEARVPVGMVRVDTTPAGAGGRNSASPVQATLGLPSTSLIPAAQPRELQRAVPPDELKQASTVSNTLAQWKAIDKQAAIERGNSMERGPSGAPKRQFPVELRQTSARGDGARELQSDKIGFA